MSPSWGGLNTKGGNVKKDEQMKTDIREGHKLTEWWVGTLLLRTWRFIEVPCCHLEEVEVLQKDTWHASRQVPIVLRAATLMTDPPLSPLSGWWVLVRTGL